jgi:hypothetical protein
MITQRLMQIAVLVSVLTANVACSAFANMRWESYDEQLQPSIGQPISAVAARIGTPYRVVQVGTEDHYVYLDGKFSPQVGYTSGDVTNGEFSGTTRMTGGDFVGCIITFRVRKETNEVVGVSTEPHTNNQGQGGCPGKLVQVATN